MGWLHEFLGRKASIIMDFCVVFIYLIFLNYRHEDGTVRFWDASGVALTPIYKLSTANVFHTDCDPCDDPPDPNDDPDMQQEEEWPPFRKASSEQEEHMCIITFGYV